ncbi:MFS transporter [Variovorax sp. J22G73]|uniref:MFS transporter n=1 Tax=unclassified Variovorax TaxID=663243 RepID=UPI0025767E17|nr:MULTISPECIES: MFS transporter [unclassified Variovorax]MDM0010491.1 MFS transporter [Variovorax sp. J22R203]MDM0102926.1 MFS transporter [Variovorax sp. J22G73]
METISLSHRQRGTLVAAGLGFVVVLLDVSVVNVALETLRVSFGTDVAGLQWVVNAYTLVFAALLLTSGALGDRMGAKRVFMAGFAVFTLASLACGLAPSLALLVVSRVVQGMGAALLVPSSLMLLQQAFPNPAQRSRAVGWWGAAGGIALAAGPVLGGLLIAHVGWRGIFLINLPIGALGLALTLCYAPTAAAKPSRGLDLPGQLAAMLALASLTAALTEASRLGWFHPLVCGGIAISLISATAFYWLERHSKEPMLPLSLFRSTTFSIATAVGVVVNFAYYGLVFVFSLFFQAVQQLSPQQTGLAFLPMTAILMVMNIVAGRLVTRAGTRALMVAGLALASLGYLLLLRVDADRAYLTLVLPMLLAASGIALVVPTMTNATLSSVDAAHAGIASGVLNSARQIGGMLGVAVCGFFVRDTEPGIFLHGMHVSLALAVVLLSAGGILSYFGLKKPNLADTTAQHG